MGAQQSTSKVFTDMVSETIMNTISKSSISNNKKLVHDNKSAQKVNIDMRNSVIKPGCETSFKQIQSIKTNIYYFSDIQVSVKQSSDISKQLSEDVVNTIKQSNEYQAIGSQENDSIVQNISDTLTSGNFIQMLSDNFSESIQAYNRLSQENILDMRNIVCEGKLNFSQLASIESLYESVTNSLLENTQLGSLTEKLDKSYKTTVEQKNVGTNIVAVFALMALMGLMYLMISSGGMMGGGGGMMKILLPIILLIVFYFMWKSEKYHKYALYILIALVLYIFYSIFGGRKTYSQQPQMVQLVPMSFGKVLNKMFK